MKRLNIFSNMKYLVATLLFAGLLTQCKDINDFGNMNQDPTQANNIDPGMEFTTVELGAAGSRFEMWRANLIYASAITQQLAQTWWAGNFYTKNEEWVTAFWNVAYAGNGITWLAQIKNVQDLINNLQSNLDNDPSLVNKLAVARIMSVFIYHRVTDLYGNAPYFNGGMGYIAQDYAPKYDKQSDIYTDMFKELDEAVNQLDPNQPTYGSADLIYNGDIDQWKRFANSLRLRLALRLVKIELQTAQQQAEAAIDPANGGVMNSNDDMAIVPHQDGPSTGPAGINTNANSEVFAVDRPYLSQTLVNWMNDFGDPRLEIYGEVNDPNNPVGLPNGYDASTIQNHSSWSGSFDTYIQLNTMLMDLDDPMIFQTYAEVEFMLAEAAVRWPGSNFGDAEEHYNNGVRAAMTYLTLYDATGAVIPNGQINTYLINNPFNNGGTDAEKLEQINNQYWAAVFLNGIEAWANWRRSGFPVLEPSPVDDPNPWPGNQSNGEIPRRLLYPEVEGLLNQQNYDEAITNQGPNNFTTRVWWDAP